MPVYSTPDEYKNGYLPQGYVLPETEPVELQIPPIITKKPTLFDALAPLPKFKEVANYNPYTIPGEIDGYELFAGNFIDSQSPQETIAIKQRIEARKSILGVESDSEFIALMTIATIGPIITLLLCAFLCKKYITKFKNIAPWIKNAFNNLNTPTKRIGFLFFSIGTILMVFSTISYGVKYFDGGYFINSILFKTDEYDSEPLFGVGFYIAVAGYLMSFLYDKTVKRIVNWIKKGSL